MRLQLIVLAVLLLAVKGWGQESESKKTEINFLYGYYEQTGDNGAVEGGRGSEQLENSAPMVHIIAPVSSKGTLDLKAGIDTYTSASSAQIEKYPLISEGATVTSASTGQVVTPGSDRTQNAVSGKDTRRHFTIGYKELLKDQRSEIGISGGYSKEFDVKSFNVGVSYSGKSEDENTFWSFNGSVFVDKWLIIYPGEIRAGFNTGAGENSVFPRRSTISQLNPKTLDLFDDDEEEEDDEDDEEDDDEEEEEEEDDDDDDYGHGVGDGSKKPNDQNPFKYPTENRNTYTVGFTYGKNINRWMNFALITDITFQKGILHTPFHRVYFQDGIEEEENKLVRSENLPNQRTKYALGFRFNYFLTNRLITRFYYRYYYDTFRLKGKTFQLELPFKVTPTITLYPFYRYYKQEQSKYFQPYGQHDIDANYYTSDYDLSSFESNKSGIGIKLAPPEGLMGKQLSEKTYLRWHSIEFRYAQYSRTTGLEANNYAFKTKFTF